MTHPPTTAWIKACLNGSRRPGDHPALPLTPDQTAEEAASAAAAGAASVHVHVRDAAGAQTVDATHVTATLRAVRARNPRLAIGVTTGAWIERDAERRLALVRAWSELPDFASVNFSEDGAADLAHLLIERGVGVEAGLWSAADARALVASGLQGACVRYLLEPREREPGPALETARAMEAILDDAGAEAPRLLHGSGPTAWPLLRAAVQRRLQARIGLEDTLALPDGAPADGNGALMAAAMAVARGAAG